MMKNPSKHHKIDTLFPITLFFVLTVFALMVIVLAAKIYENTTDHSHRNHQSRIALSYISEKIHQSDDDCKISMEKFENLDALTIAQAYEGSNYYTYIYFYEGTLRELFAKEEVNISPSDGKIILELSDFSMAKVEDNLLYFVCTDSKNQTADSYVSIPD